MNTISETEKGNDLQRSQLRMMRLQTAMIAAILAIVLAVGILAVVQFSSMRRCVDMIGEKVPTIDPESLNDAVKALTDAAGQFNSIDTDALNDAVAAFTDAAAQFNKIDMEKLNETIASLREAAEKLRDMDIEKLNELVTSLDNTAEKLRGAVSAITGIFPFKK